MAENRITFDGDYDSENSTHFYRNGDLRGGYRLFIDGNLNFVVDTTGDDDYPPFFDLVLDSSERVAHSYDAGIYFDARDGLFLNATGGNFGDVFIGTANADRLSGAGGDDQLYGLAGDDVLNGGAGQDLLDGGDGIDTVSYAGGGGVEVALYNARLNTGDAAGDNFVGIENVVGSSFADYLYGDTGENTLSGGAGDDYLDGQRGVDVLIGGAGADYLFGGSDDRTLDYASYADAASGVTASLARPNQNTGDAAGDNYFSIEGLIGSDYADTLKAAGGTIIDGGAGGDRLFGSAAGNDTLIGGDGNDRIRAGAQAGFISGGDGEDTLFLSGNHSYTSSSFLGIETVRLAAGANADFRTVRDGVSFRLDDGAGSSLVGTKGADVIVAGAGFNILDGGFGADRITGGAGQDYFTFTSVEARGSAIDAITDFSHAEADRIDLSNLDTDSETDGVQVVTFVDAFSAAGTAEVLFRGDDTGGKLLFDFDGNGRWDHAIGITSDGPITSADVLTFAPM